MSIKTPPLKPCPACKLGEPEILSRPSPDPRGDGYILLFRAWCPTCAHGLDRQADDDPVRVVRSWNADADAAAA